MKRGDRFLILLLMALFLASLAPFLPFFHASKSALHAEFSVDGKLVLQLNLTALEGAKRRRVGEHHEIEVERGRARIRRADCTDQDCVRVGWLHRPGSVAICLPYRATLKLTGTTTKAPTLDALSF